VVADLGDAMCARCHEFPFQNHTPNGPFTLGDEPAQATFSEWRASSAPGRGDTCATCHAQEYADWKGSVHSKALEGRFKKVWTELGKKPACLRCHVTGQTPGTLQYAHAGVTC
jgi:hypothetical protein